MVLTYGGTSAYKAIPVELPYDIVRFIEELDEVDRIQLNDIVVSTLQSTKHNIETWKMMGIANSEPHPDVY